MSYPMVVKDPLDNPPADAYTSSKGLEPPLDGLPSDPDGAAPFGIPFNKGSSPNQAASSEETLKLSMKTILDLFVLEEEHVDPSTMDMDDDDDDEDPPVDLEDQAERIKRLCGIRPALEQLWWNESKYMTSAAEKLADGSRDPKWRIPLGESGILDSFLTILATPGTQNSLMIHVLRLIGNSCADTDENREIVVSKNYLPSIIALINETPLLPFVIPVLFNICVDYEPAQQRASEALLSKALIGLVSSPQFEQSRAFLGYVCRLLDLLITKPTEPDNAPENTAAILINLAANSEFHADYDDFLALANTSIAYLQHQRFQEALIKYSAVDSALKTLLLSYTRFEDTSAEMFASEEQEEYDPKQLVAMRTGMNQVLSDVSALPEFTNTYPVLSHFTSSLRRWLSSPQKQLRVCACIMLGNIARSDSACEEFVHACKVHLPLIEILKDTNDTQLLHASLGFLRNLALPSRNKIVLGDSGIFDVLERLWSMDTVPQIQYSSISLVRILFIGTFENVQRVAGHLSSDPDSPAYSKSQLSILISIFNRSDAEPVKMEIARLFTAMCRVFTSPVDSVPDSERRRKRFFEKHPDIGRPVSYMVTQNKWPVVRSEGWFVMALICRNLEGAQIVSEILHDINVFQPLVELLTGKSLVDGKPVTPSSSPKSEEIQSFEGTTPSSSTASQSADMVRIDRENALVLVSELMKHCGANMAPMRKTVFEDLLKGGGVVHLSYAQVRAREDFYDGKVQNLRMDRNVQDMEEKHEDILS